MTLIFKKINKKTLKIRRDLTNTSTVCVARLSTKGRSFAEGCEFESRTNFEFAGLAGTVLVPWGDAPPVVGFPSVSTEWCFVTKHVFFLPFALSCSKKQGAGCLFYISCISCLFPKECSCGLKKTKLFVFYNTPLLHLLRHVMWPGNVAVSHLLWA